MSGFGASAAPDPTDEDVVLDFGAESDASNNQTKFRHPVVVTFHLAFRSLAFIIFLFGGQFSRCLIKRMLFRTIFLISKAGCPCANLNFSPPSPSFPSSLF